MKKIILCCFVILSFINVATTQESYSTQVNLKWSEDQFSDFQNPDKVITYETFDGAAFDSRNPEIARYLHHMPLSGHGKLEVSIFPLSTSTMNIVDNESQNSLSSDFQVSSSVTQAKLKFQGNISITPIRKSSTGFEKLESFRLVVNFTPSALSSFRDLGMTTSSVLGSGSIYKIAIPQEGVYKIDGNFLSDNFDISLDGLNSNDIQVFGNEGGRLPRATSAEQPDDLLEIPILMNDGDDDAFGGNDFFLFYAEGSDQWTYGNESASYSYDKNVYDVNNYIFIKIDGNNGLRIQTIESDGIPDYTSDEFDYLQIYEEDRTNLLGAFDSTTGTGKEWFGDYYGQETSFSYGDKFDITDLSQFGEGVIKMRFAARGENQTTVKFSVNGNEFQKNGPGTNLGDIEADYAKSVVFEEDINLTTGQNTIGIEYVKSTSEDEGWLDFIQLNYRKRVPSTYNQLRVSDSRSLSANIASIAVPNGNFTYWDVTDINNTKLIEPKGGNIIYQPNGELKTFYYVRNDSYLIPEAIEPITNQNLHTIAEAEMVIIYHSDFEDSALRLAEHRRSFSGLSVVTVNIHEIYNEFSSGRLDPTAIRDFIRMVSLRDPDFNYLLLIGDGSYDYRNLTPNLLDHNFIPVYETDESLDPINGFPTDDYYVLLSDGEGADLRGALDATVGRLPVTDVEMANAVVDKIISYDTNKDALGDWRLKIAFAADDEDSNLHLRQSDNLAENVEVEDPIYNQAKIFYDSYIQESTPGGDRYPAASEAINSTMQKGALVFNYMGHGGPKGWAQERVLKTTDIETWNNADQLPLLVTATCSFTGYDDPALVSAGEVAIQKAKGGVVGLFTTVRAVYASENERLAKAVFDVIFKKENGQPQTFGDIITNAKNQNADSNSILNDRKFALIGDPAQRIAIPTYNIETVSINGNPASEVDTLSALEQVTIRGKVTNENGETLNDFNGIVSTTIYDKESTLETLANDGGSTRQFGVYRSILFKGSATVANGEFEFTFVMPTDINYEFGSGRISYYAHDEDSRDAAGNFNSVIIGGSDPNAVADNEGPQIELFMNDEKFVFGGTTNSDPVLLALLSDDLGINVSGTSIGHDITAILDEDTQNSFILNEFYEANINDFTSGKVRFPLNDLEPGKHSITLKAWDVSNNSTEGRLEFTVINQEDESLRNVFNYPNPFTTNTSFLFEHDLAGSDLDVFVDIYTVSGKLVRTIEQSVFGSGFRVDNISWDAKDDFGSRLAKGLYLYKIKVVSRELNQYRESDFEKLVIL